jgi:RimJ/RimL family protein N-acetyltransferase
MDMVTEIVTARLRLRPFVREDLPAFVAYRREPVVARYQSWEDTYSLDDAERMFKSQEGLALGQPGDFVQLAILDRGTGTMHGDCAVRVLIDQPATAELGVTLATASQGAGRATEALTAVVSVLFESYGLHRVYAETDDRNPAVHRLFERVGFRCEGRLVEADWFKGEWSTLRIYALLAREWHAGAPAREPGRHPGR